MNIFRFFPGYETIIFENGREPAFVMMLTFLITYIIARGYTRLARKTGWGSAKFGGVHAHHMVFGVVLSFVSASLLISFLPEQGWFLLLLSASIGAGMALVLDEFALLLHLKDVYWEKEGRKSIDAIVLGVVFGNLFLLHLTPFGINDQETIQGAFVIALINVTFSLICALKGKIFFTLLGIFIPTISLLGAFRLAEPNSLWARRFYDKNSAKAKKSIERYLNYEKVWRYRKEKMWDIIGGRIGRPEQSIGKK